MFPVPDLSATIITDQVAGWSETYPMPKVTSLDEETHLFHYSEDWEDSRLIFVNKNGNQQRLMFVAGEWCAYATWRDIFPSDAWEFKGLKGDDPERVIAKMSVGPGRDKSETLCFLPRDAAETSTRLLIYRHHILGLRKVRNSDAFTLHHWESQTTSPEFAGKPWECLAATKWAREELADWKPPILRGSGANPFTREREQEAAVATLEENVLFGAWG